MPEKELNAYDGEYRIQGLAPGRYRLSLSTAGEPALGEIDVGAKDATLDLVLEPR